MGARTRERKRAPVRGGSISLFQLLIQLNGFGRIFIIGLGARIDSLASALGGASSRETTNDNLSPLAAVRLSTLCSSAGCSSQLRAESCRALGSRLSTEAEDGRAWTAVEGRAMSRRTRPSPSNETEARKEIASPMELISGRLAEFALCSGGRKW